MPGLVPLLRPAAPIGEISYRALMAMGVLATVAQSPAEVVLVPAAVTGERETMDPFEGPFVCPQLTTTPPAEGAPPEHVIPLLTTPLAAEGARSDTIMVKSVAVGELSYVVAPDDHNWIWQPTDQFTTRY
mmetsp:Transcript_48925/g.102152  ORF Transcript_48925/g.102152 Transcript_48925/m.102152 type:complete len:130 (-) Transcript_48925:177-566(-)